MANVRLLNKEKYNIGNYRFRELYYFCLQYEEWKEVLNEKRNTLKGISYQETKTSATGSTSDQTMNAAISCAEYANKCSMIEAAAKIADPELHEYILYAVTHENVTFKYLKMQKGIPCERDRYYDSRRKFYFHLDKLL